MRNLIDDDGENLAIRSFLAVYADSENHTIRCMRGHLAMSGFAGCWPNWVEYGDGHLTKGAAQEWLRHLFALEKPAHLEADAAIAWAIEQWQGQVGNRPMINVFRGVLDSVWRQVIRHFGGDDRVLIGPTHLELVSEPRYIGPTCEAEQQAPAGEVPSLNDAADAVVIANSTGNPALFLRAVEKLIAAARLASTPPAAQDPQPDSCGYITVKHSAVDWLKKHYPALCEKSGLCQPIAGRLYTITKPFSAAR